MRTQWLDRDGHPVKLGDTLKGVGVNEDLVGKVVFLDPDESHKAFRVLNAKGEIKHMATQWSALVTPEMGFADLPGTAPAVKTNETVRQILANDDEVVFRMTPREARLLLEGAIVGWEGAEDAGIEDEEARIAWAVVTRLRQALEGRGH